MRAEAGWWVLDSPARSLSSDTAPRPPAEPCPSTLLQQHMADLLRQGPDVAPSFLNSVLNQLNWAFSEFVGMIQEVGPCGALKA